jgi:hypothetical protein
MAEGRDDFPYGSETTLTAGLNAVMDALEGKEPSFPFGNETPLTAGINAILARIDGVGGGYVLTEQDKADIADVVREGMVDGDLADW